MTITDTRQLTVSHREICGPVTLGWAWDLYRDAFTDIDAQAAQRHLMTRDEFDHVMTDRRIRKYFAFHGGTPVGLAVITNDLDAWPLISPRYFARQWPDLYAARRIFYIGFACTVTGAPNHTFHDLIADLSKEVFAVDGMAVMDFCTRNAIGLRMPRRVGALLNHLHPAASEARLIDTQEFWAWRFDGNGWVR